MTSGNNQPSRRRATIVVLVVALIIIIPLSVDTTIHRWNEIFDDAYISFRYSQNLADGAGLVWNVGEAPTEGYTNPLLVVLLAPFLAAGADPLIVARALSLAALAAIALTLFKTARDRYDCGYPEALAVAALPLMLPASLSLVLVGMETVLFALALLATLIVGANFLFTNSLKLGVGFAVLGFATTLLRPEGALLIAIVLMAWLWGVVREHRSWPAGLVTLFVLVGLTLPYLLWKASYFGALLPNPFYIKSAGAGINPSGTSSVRGFFALYSALVMLVAFAILTRFRSESHVADDPRAATHSRVSIERRLALITIVVFLLFFLRTDTLMDIEGRFLYPLTPLLLLVAIPPIRYVVRFATNPPTRNVLLGALALGAFFVVSAGIPVDRLVRMTTVTEWQSAAAGMSAQLDANRQLQMARSLREYPEIDQLRIAYGDAGVIPFFTRAKWLDPVGLNDSFIARTRDKQELVDYFFQQSPDVVVLPADHEGGWITYGHGPLGNYESWSADPRWDEYTYVGTLRRSDTPYDLHFFVNRGSASAPSITDHLKTSVVDGWFRETPLPIGTSMPPSANPWTDRAGETE